MLPLPRLALSLFLGNRFDEISQRCTVGVVVRVELLEQVAELLLSILIESRLALATQENVDQVLRSWNENGWISLVDEATCLSFRRWKHQLENAVGQDVTPLKLSGVEAEGTVALAMCGILSEGLFLGCGPGGTEFIAVSGRCHLHAVGDSILICPSLCILLELSQSRLCCL